MHLTFHDENHESHPYVNIDDFFDGLEMSRLLAPPARSRYVSHSLIQLLVRFYSHVIKSTATAALNPLNTTLRRIILPETYIKEVRPPSIKGNPVVVEFSVFVIDINSINVEDMDFRVDMFVHQKWTEPRLTLSDDLFEDGDDFVTLPPEFFEYLWQPDPYFLNSKVSGECKKIKYENSSMKSHNNRIILSLFMQFIFVY